MKALASFKHIGNALALADTLPDNVAKISIEIATRMYPYNMNCRVWAVNNIRLFFDNERVERVIMRLRKQGSPNVLIQRTQWTPYTPK